VTIFDEVERFARDELYVKVLTASNVSLSTDWNDVKRFTIPSGSEYVALVHSINADESVDAEIDITVDDQTLGEKYGFPISTKALVEPIKVNAKIEKGEVKIRARSKSGTVTLGYLAVIVIFIKRGVVT